MGVNTWRARDLLPLALRPIREAGFDPLDASPLEVARFIDPFTLIIAMLAHETSDKPAVACRFERFAELD